MATSSAKVDDLGILRGGAWRQWSAYSGEDVYENLSTGELQFHEPLGYEDDASACDYLT